MQVKEIMTRNPEVLEPNASLQAAAQKMEALDVGVIPICDGNKLVGMITDRDVTVRATAEGWDPNQLKVEDAMTDEVIYAYADQSTEEIAQIMEENQIRRLPILDRTNDELIGIVSLGDLAVEGRSDELSAEALEEISKPAEPNR